MIEYPRSVAATKRLIAAHRAKEAADREYLDAVRGFRAATDADEGGEDATWPVYLDGYVVRWQSAPDGASGAIKVEPVTVLTP